MKTNREIHAEALQLATIGQRFASEARGAVAAPQRTLARVSEVGLSFPSDENWLAANVRPSGLGRYIDAVVVRDELVFRLLEVEAEKRSPDLSFNEDEAVIVQSSDSPFEVLHAGYPGGQRGTLSVLPAWSTATPAVPVTAEPKCRGRVARTRDQRGGRSPAGRRWSMRSIGPETK